MGSYGNRWLQCTTCQIWGQCLDELPLGILALLDIDGCGLFCEACHDRWQSHGFNPWDRWLSQHEQGLQVSVVDTAGKGYEPTGKGNGGEANGDEAYEATHGLDNGGKGTAAKGKGNGDQGAMHAGQGKGAGSSGFGSMDAPTSSQCVRYYWWWIPIDTRRCHVCYFCNQDRYLRRWRLRLGPVLFERVVSFLPCESERWSACSDGRR